MVVIVFNFQESENIFLFPKVNNFKNNIFRVKYSLIKIASLWQPLKKWCSRVLNKALVPVETNMADLDSSWPPDDPGENGCLQHLSLHNEVENHQNSHLKIHEPTFQTSTMAWHTPV